VVILLQAGADFSTRNAPIGTNTMITKRMILIVDDDADLRQSLEVQLPMTGEFGILTAETAAKGIEVVKKEQLDLVVLDVGLPDMDGREMCKHLRKHGFKKPIVMLTGDSSDADQILGFESGANDYITKPFKLGVLLARIRVHLREHEQTEDAVFAIGPYSFKPAAKMLLSQMGAKIHLTDKETLMLKHLYRAREKVVTREGVAAGSVGLSLRRHDAYARNAHLPLASEDRKRPFAC